MPLTLLSSAGVDPEELVQENLSLYRFLGGRRRVRDRRHRPEFGRKAPTAALATRLGIAAASLMIVIEQVDRDAAERRLLLTWER